MKKIDGLISKNHPQLIPIFKKPERKLLSIFMAVLDIVPEFRAEVLKRCGYGSGKTSQYESFMEPHYESPSLPNRYPDGLIVCRRGKTTWSAFVEAKVEGNKIRPEQIQEYADFASRLDVDAVISISNEFALNPIDLPYHLASNKRRKREVFHLSWPEIRTEIGLFVGKTKDCNDAEIAVLKHALTFMLSDHSGVKTYDSMPKDWAKFVESANTALGFGANTSGVMEIIRGWQQERRDLCAKLNGEFGGAVELCHPAGARASPEDCAKYDRKLLTDKYQLEAGYIFAKSKRRLNITSDLRACSHRFVLEISPPADKKAKATVTWLATKLSGLPGDRYDINFRWPGRGEDTSVSLDELSRFPEIVYEGRKDAPRIISIVLRQRNVRRFKSRKQFIEDLEKNALLVIQDASQHGVFG